LQGGLQVRDGGQPAQRFAGAGRGVNAVLDVPKPGLTAAVIAVLCPYRM
jgi:hypothetical protein